MKHGNINGGMDKNEPTNMAIAAAPEHHKYDPEGDIMSANIFLT